VLKDELEKVLKEAMWPAGVLNFAWEGLGKVKPLSVQRVC